MILKLWKLVFLFAGELVQKAKRGSVAKTSWHTGRKKNGYKYPERGAKVVSFTASGVWRDNKIFSLARAYPILAGKQELR